MFAAEKDNSIALAKKKLTCEDYDSMTPEEWGYELIDGEIIQMTSPNILHQRISRKLLFELESYNRKKMLGEFFEAPTDVKINEYNLVEPDILFIANEQQSIIKENRIEGAPDLVVEILSPSTGYYDLRKKYSIYESAGVKEYWIVDPNEKLVELYKNQETGFVLEQKLKEKGILKSNILIGIELDINVLW